MSKTEARLNAAKDRAAAPVCSSDITGDVLPIVGGYSGG